MDAESWSVLVVATTGAGLMAVVVAVGGKQDAAVVGGNPLRGETATLTGIAHDVDVHSCLRGAIAGVDGEHPVGEVYTTGIEHGEVVYCDGIVAPDVGVDALLSLAVSKCTHYYIGAVGQRWQHLVDACVEWHHTGAVELMGAHELKIFEFNFLDASIFYCME